MTELLQIAFKVTLIIFMAGNLFGMGLQLNVADALAPLRKPRFVMATLLACFVFSPALAYLITLVIPMERPYAVGLLLLGLAPSAPYLPLVSKKAGGDLAATASLLLLASLGTVGIMVVGVPFVAADLSANPWAIAKPLLFLLLIPLAAGMILKHLSSATAGRLHPPVKAITNLGTLLFLVVALLLDYKIILGALGSGAFAAQILFVVGLTLGGYWMMPGLEPEQRIVLSLGIASRNVGAPGAVVGTDGDQQIMAMLIIGMFVTVAASFGAAAWFARKAGQGKAPC